MIEFKATPYQVKDWLILLLPQVASSQLPSRGLVLVKGTANGQDFLTALEPDGNGSHWFRVTKELAKTTGVTLGKQSSFSVESSKDWPEPEVPTDIAAAIDANHEARATWDLTTPLAHWEWVRWIRATDRDETRKKRIGVACSKLEKGMRRPCCFNANMCTYPEVSKSGVLLQPEQAAALVV